MLEAQRTLARYAETINVAAQVASRSKKAMRLYEEISGARVQSLVKELERESERIRELVRASARPIEGLGRAGRFNLDTPFHRAMERAQQFVADYESRFQLPEIGEAARLMGEFRASSVAGMVLDITEETSSIQKAMEAMHQPWLDTADSLRSIGGFAGLQSIGRALGEIPAFGEQLTDALRVGLGDWRDRISWPKPIFTDLVARTEFYMERGFDPALADFPAPAFRESLDIAGLVREPPALVERYGPPVPHSVDDEKEEGLARTNDAHDWLQRLETQLRRFIDEAMTTAFGPDWARHRLPKDIYDAWQDTKRKVEQGDRPELPLIAYADFTDYERVICKRDNWREVFAPTFGRIEDVRESLQRLSPIRVCTMHARPITQDDELLLYVEARRLAKVIL